MDVQKCKIESVEGVEGEVRMVGRDESSGAGRYVCSFVRWEGEG